MNVSSETLLTPVYLKTSDDMPLPRHDAVFYLLTSSGLFLCRNHEFYRSSVPARVWPTELAPHRQALELNYPRLPQRLMEQVIGFFACVAERDGAEAAVLLGWNSATRTVEVIVPPQISRVTRSMGGQVFPMDLSYEMPPLPPEWQLLGDMHSHVYGAAYTSGVDAADEVHRPGLHWVVGKVDLEPPDLHVEATVDGRRFRIQHPWRLIEGYTTRKPADVPPAWFDQVRIETWSGLGVADNPPITTSASPR
jgi:hypothetical protein